MNKKIFAILISVVFLLTIIPFTSTSLSIEIKKVETDIFSCKNIKNNKLVLIQFNNYANASITIDDKHYFNEDCKGTVELEIGNHYIVYDIPRIAHYTWIDDGVETTGGIVITGQEDYGVNKTFTVTDDGAMSPKGHWKHCCFPAGTKITMADGDYKNIEDIKIGDKVLSYDIINDEYGSWHVKILGNPIHPIININNGLIKATIDHPLYIRKSSGIKGWGSYVPFCAKKAITYKGEILNLEVGDQIFSSNKEWITIESITFNPEPVQTYNILSFSGQKTYFANGILVYEEHPPQCITDYLLDLIGNVNTQLEILIRNSLVLNNIYNYLP